MTAARFAESNRASEWSFSSKRERGAPFDVSVDVVFSSPDGRALRVPAFWAGGLEWRVRFAPDVPGLWRFKSEASDPSDPGLHGIDGSLEVMPHRGDHPLSSRGPLRVSATGRYLEHRDGTPFFWLGDTWWMLLSERVSWPEGFRALTADRVKKGFTVVQIVAGFQPDTDPFDGRDANAGGAPWQREYAAINPAYFDAADVRIEWLVRSGIVPCIVGSWGYHVRWMGTERMKAHWRYLVARYGAYPVIWCLAGEATMAYYLSQDREREESDLLVQWSEIARFVRRIDPYHHPISIHPRGGTGSWSNIDSPDLVDLNMLQPGHLPNGSAVGVALVTEGRARVPPCPVVNAEPAYEAHLQANYQDVQRFTFWTGFLLGQAGHTYGAAGIFQANDRERPTGARPDGGAFDSMFWDDAMSLPGSAQLGLGKALLCRYPWWRFQPHPEWAEFSVRWGAQQYSPAIRAYSAGIPREVRVIYLPRRFYHWDGPLVRALESDIAYRAYYFDPTSGREHDLGTVTPDGDANWQAPTLPVCQDWVLVLERV